MKRLIIAHNALKFPTFVQNGWEHGTIKSVVDRMVVPTFGRLNNIVQGGVGGGGQEQN